MSLPKGFENTLRACSNKNLLNMLENAQDYEEEAVNLCKMEIERRGGAAALAETPEQEAARLLDEERARNAALTDAERSATSNAASRGNNMASSIWLPFSFKGRINRNLYWRIWLPCVLLFIAVDLFLNTPMSTEEHQRYAIMQWMAAALWAVVIPWVLLATYAKRWHDLDKSGWNSLIVLIPVIGWIWVKIECGFKKGINGPNTYGYPWDAPGASGE